MRFVVFDKHLHSHSFETYDYQREYSGKLSQIYSQYLQNNPFLVNCSKQTGRTSDITDDDIIEAIQVADEDINSLLKIDENFLKSSPDSKKFSAFIYKANIITKFNEIVTKKLTQLKCINKYESELNFLIKNTPKHVTNNGQYCDMNRDVSDSSSGGVRCNPNYKYRQIDGKCNNLKQTNWGSAFHCQRRLLPPDYSDGVSGQRLASDGSPLPIARFISTTITNEFDVYDRHRNSMQMLWGQLVVHDMVKTLQYMGNTVGCCPPKPLHPECMQSYLPPEQLTIAYNQSCMSFPRSTACNTCRLGTREQMNAQTAYLDLSMIYGFEERQAIKLRTFEKGKLITNKSLTSETPIPPMVELPDDQDIYDIRTTCNFKADRPLLKCFKSGDGMRSNQQPLIATIISTFVIRHNQHCDGLAKVNPHWTDDVLYREARRLLEAEYNFIIFYEYLPSILNKDLMNYFNLNVKPHGEYSEYNPVVSPDVINEVQAGALRFSHSNINSVFPIIDKNPLKSSSITLRYEFRQAIQLWEGKTNGILKGLCEDRQELTDLNFVADVREFNLISQCAPKIVDLFSIDILRARDHGIPAYIYFVDYCTGHKITCWDDLRQYIPDNVIEKLKQVYKDYKDIDLIIGGLAERLMNGSNIGPTFACMIGIQFYHLKFGDRFYFEHGDQAGSFTIDQLDNIKHTASLANLLCKVTDFDEIQVNPMYIPSNYNRYIHCSHLSEINYRLWKDQHI
ncbi:peroxidase-like [Oppia nitens]|uniref:peroxidase-like n=1 Tax=Oppia nitens TaxID=1686743 RepID=UPI0023DAD4A0|nr:peroxidase-like [Oppia nitens]